MHIFIDDSTPGGGGSGSTTTWSTTDKTGSMTLSNGNLTCAFPFSGVNQAIRATAGFTAGTAKYFEISADLRGSASQFVIGLKPLADNLIVAAGTLLRWIGSGAVHIDGTQVYGATDSQWTTGDKLGVAIDASRRVYVRVNGTWANSGNPEAGTGYVGTMSAGTYYPWALLGDGQAASTATLNFGATAYYYTPPSGFSAI